VKLAGFESSAADWTQLDSPSPFAALFSRVVNPQHGTDFVPLFSAQSAGCGGAMTSYGLVFDPRI